jgi:hypothetical protein
MGQSWSVPVPFEYSNFHTIYITKIGHFKLTDPDRRVQRRIFKSLAAPIPLSKGIQPRQSLGRAPPTARRRNAGRDFSRSAVRSEWSKRRNGDAGKVFRRRAGR